MDHYNKFENAAIKQFGEGANLGLAMVDSVKTENYVDKEEL